MPELEPQMFDFEGFISQFLNFVKSIVILAVPLIACGIVYPIFRSKLRMMFEVDAHVTVNVEQPERKCGSEWDVPVRKSKYPKPSHTARAGTWITSANTSYFEGATVNETE